MASVFDAAEKYLGIPYILGGDGESGMDCGLLTQKAFGDIGITLDSRCADDQAAQLQAAGGFSDTLDGVEPGDLIFFKNTYGNWPEGTITHVAIYVDEDQLLQACSSKGVAYTHDLQGYWMDFFAGIGKISTIIPAPEA